MGVPFSPLDASAELISASGTSASATLSPFRASTVCLTVIAAATGVRMHIKMGTGTTTATANDFCLPLVVGAVHYIAKPQEYETVAVILNAGTATISVTPGDGGL